MMGLPKLGPFSGYLEDPIRIDILYRMWYSHYSREVRMAELKRLPAAFYRSPGGREPVREWLLALDERNRRIVGRDIATEITS